MYWQDGLQFSQRFRRVLRFAHLRPGFTVRKFGFTSLVRFTRKNEKPSEKADHVFTLEGLHLLPPGKNDFIHSESVYRTLNPAHVLHNLI